MILSFAFIRSPRWLLVPLLWLGVFHAAGAQSIFDTQYQPLSDPLESAVRVAPIDADRLSGWEISSPSDRIGLLSEDDLGLIRDQPVREVEEAEPNWETAEAPRRWSEMVLPWSIGSPTIGSPRSSQAGFATR